MKNRLRTVALPQRSGAAPLLLAVAAMAQLVSSGCAPTLLAIEPVVAPALAARPLRTIAVLPVDLWIDADDPDDGRLLSERVSRASTDKAAPIVGAAIREELARHGYRVVDVDWDGTVPDARARRSAIPPSVLDALADWMLDYGRRTQEGRATPGHDGIGGSLPYFDADATLFVGGEGHLREDESHRARTAKQAVIGVTVGLLVVAVVAVLALAISKGGGSGLSAIGSGLGHVAEGSARVAAAGARVAVASTRVAAMGLRVGARLADPRIGLRLASHLDLGRGGWDAHRTGDGEPAPFAGVRAASAPPGVDSLDYGSDVRRAPIGRTALAPPGSDNLLRLGATLVDNRTGQVLWSSAQLMEVDPVDPRELCQATEHVLAQLPPAAPALAAR